MQTQIWLMFVFGTMILFLQGEDCLRINDLMVPNVVENGSEEDVILDCDYDFEDSDERGLVVKWFLNEGETPVYQWIPPKAPQDFGKLKLPASYRVTPLSSLKSLDTLSSTPFDFSQIPPQASAQDIRELLAGQIHKQNSRHDEYRDVKQLMALKSLKGLKYNNRHPISPQSDPNAINWSILADTMRKLLAERNAAEVTTTATPIMTTTTIPPPPVTTPKKESPPQVYIQFIELPSRAVEVLLSKRQPGNHTYAPDSETRQVFQRHSNYDHQHQQRQDYNGRMEPAKDNSENIYSRKHYEENYGTPQQNFLPQQQQVHSTPAYPNNRYPPQQHHQQYNHHPQGPASSNNYIMPPIPPLPPPAPENDESLPNPTVPDLQ